MHVMSKIMNNCDNKDAVNIAKAAVAAVAHSSNLVTAPSTAHSGHKVAATDAPTVAATPWDDGKPKVSLLAFDQQLAQLDAFLTQFPIAVALEQSTGVRRSLLAVASFGVLLLMLLLTHGAGMISDVIGFTYPFLATLKVMRRGRGDGTEWTTYWLLFAFFTMFEEFFEFALESHAWAPMFYLSKILFQVWCFLPHTKGINLVHAKLIMPLLGRMNDAPPSMAAPPAAGDAAHAHPH